MNEAFSLLWQKTKCSAVRFKPDYQVYAATLKSCASTIDLNLGKGLHSRVVKLGHDSCLLVSKALLNMYAKCKALDDCQYLFGQITHPDAVTWNILLSGFSGSWINHDIKVMRLFYAMHVGEYPKPNSVTIAIVLPVCARSRDLIAGKSVHSYAIKCGFESQTLAGNALLSMYAKLGHVQDYAYHVFDEIAEKDVVSWNAMIAGLAENSFTLEAFRMYQKMLKEGTEPNYGTVTNILPVCASLGENAAYTFGKEIHCYVLRHSELMADVSVTNALVGFYAKIGHMREAESLFQRMYSRDLVSWNSVIAGYTSNGEWLKGLMFFHKFMSAKIVEPDSVTFLSVIPACVHLKNLQAGKQIHGHIVRRPGLHEVTSVGNSLISMYSKCGDLRAAFRSFSLICKRDLISWNTMLDAFAESRLVTPFVDQLHCMFREGIRPDSITIISAIQLFATIPQVDKVKEAHGYSIKSDLLPGGIEPTLGNAFIDAYAKCGNMEYALKIFENLSGKRNVVACNSLISGYVNCGSHDNANMIFKKMSERDLTTWNLMIRVYAENEYPDQALSLLHELQNHGIKPDSMTLMSILPVSARFASVQMLRQCHGYAVRACFEDVRLKGSFLDVYSKCGSIISAYNLFQSTPQKDLVMFTAMVGGYAKHGMGEEALGVFFHMLDHDVKPDHVIITAVLSACSHAGLIDDGLKIFNSIEKVHGIKPTMEQYACVVDLLARGGRINEAYSFMTSMPMEPNANIWGTLLGACRNHHEVEMGCMAADHLFEMDDTNMGNYVVMSNLYAANARWEGVLEIRKLMRTKDLKKPAGCSWIEVDGRKNVFIAGDTSHPLSSSIFSTLHYLDRQVKELFLF